MFESITIQRINRKPGQFVPPFLESLVVAAARGDDILPYVRSIVLNLGFDTFVYGASATTRPDHRGMNYAYATTGDGWVRLYDRMGYIEADPRIFLTCKSAVPLVWDQTTVRRFGGKVDSFLDDAQRHGISSGVSFVIHGPFDSHVVVMLDSRIEINDEIRLKAISRNLPDILMFGHYFHEVFMLPAIQLGNERRPPQSPLSKRQRECLTLAAKGLTTKDISDKLNISSRTVQFHFDGIRGKLGAANRQEAIAVAVRTGDIQG